MIEGRDPKWSEVKRHLLSRINVMHIALEGLSGDRLLKTQGRILEIRDLIKEVEGDEPKAG